MRINELLEGTNFKDIDFVKTSGDKREIDFDLAEDLMHFMNNDDDVYRQHLFPIINKCKHNMSSMRPSMFKPAVVKSYKLYVKKFPIRELPDQLDEKMCNETCKKMYDDMCKDRDEGKYKD
jgi:hypothetical protein